MLPQLKWPAPVTYRSLRADFPKHHLEVGCEGLERVLSRKAFQEHAERAEVGQAPNRFDAVEWASWAALAKDHDGRPCRKCTLEPMLANVLRPGRTFASFSSQESPDDPKVELHTYKWRAASDTGCARLVRVAERQGLPVVWCENGPVTYGFFTQPTVAALGWNLRTYTRKGVTKLPGELQMQLLWTFLDEMPPELGQKDHDPWDLAELMAV